MTETAWQQQLASQLAYQIRACPSDDLLRDTGQDDNIKTHIAACPGCQERLLSVHDVSLWRQISRNQGSYGNKENMTPTPGQVWELNLKLSGWGPKNRHYNSPLVLLLEEIQEPVCAWKVAQVYGDTMLSGEADVQLSSDLGFAEAWNTYTIHIDDLERYWGEVEPSKAKEVIIEGEKEFPVIDQDSILFQFRKLEIETGAYFASQSVKKIIQELEADTTPLNNLIDLQKYLIDKHPGWKQASTKVDSVYEHLAMLKAPEEQMPLAAAAGENCISLNVVSVTGDDLQLRVAIATLSNWNLTEKGLFISGQIKGVSTEQAELDAWCDLGEKQSLHAEEDDISLDYESGYFNIQFTTPNPPERDAGRIRLLLFIHD